MKLNDVINEQYLSAESLKSSYEFALPFPHIVMENFIKLDLLKAVVNEFPDRHVMTKRSSLEIKRASKGMRALTPSAANLTAYLHSEMMLEWLNDLTGIREPLIPDPYLVGGGYHQSEKGDVLKVHSDFNKHPYVGLDRRLNLLIYLNENWKDDWGGALQLFDREMKSGQTIFPRFNTAVLFTTTSFSYHGFPDHMDCPENRSRQSLAYYYYSNGRPDHELSIGVHDTLWKERHGEKFTKNMPLSASEKYISKLSPRSVIRDCVPPILLRGIKKLLGN